MVGINGRGRVKEELTLVSGQARLFVLDGLETVGALGEVAVSTGEDTVQRMGCGRGPNALLSF